MEAYLRQFDLTHAGMVTATKKMLQAMEDGLEGQKSSLLMIPSYTDRPKGNESGVFLAIDFGGTNLRCILMSLDRNKIVNSTTSSMKLDPKIPTGDELFGTIAKFISNFLDHNQTILKKKDFLPIGFTFSFPIAQTSISSGTHIRWTKEFIADGVTGHDVVQLLHEQLDKIGLNWARVVALCNDTVGTLCAATTINPKALVGVILGTGTNACYREKVCNITKLPDSEKSDESMLINMEWGAFDGFPTTAEDDALNHETRRQGTARMEKMVSGRYLPMIFVLCMQRCIENGWVLEDLDVDGIKYDKDGQMTCIELEQIQYDETPNLDNVLQLTLRYLGMARHGEEGLKNKKQVTLRELHLIRALANAIVTRSVAYSATAIIAVCSRIALHNEVPDVLDVAIDGSIYHKHKGYKEQLNVLVRDYAKLIEHDLCIKLPAIKVVSTEDGSGIGAGIIAAVQAKKLRNTIS